MNNSKESMFSSPSQSENMNTSKESMFPIPGQDENMNNSKESMFSSPQQPLTAPNPKNQTPHHRKPQKTNKHPHSPIGGRVFWIGNDYFVSASRLANPSSKTFFSVVADRSIFSCSASDKGISMILRIPERLMTAGTPMKISLWLYSPSK